MLTKVFLKSPILTFLMFLPWWTFAAAPYQSSGSISANPTAVTAWPGSLGSTTITWSTTPNAMAEVWVSKNGNPETRVFAQASGVETISWIQAPNTYVFRLYAGTSHTTVLDSVTVQGVLPTGSVTANPTVVAAAPGQPGTSIVSWSASTQNAQVWLSVNGGPEAPFRAGKTGSQPANWIKADHTYVFRLYAGTTHSYVLDTVTVTGIPFTGNVSATPTTVVVPLGQNGSSTIIWNTNGTNAEVWRSTDGGPEELFARGAVGSKVAPWIQANRTYVFRLYAGTDHSVVLDSVTVQGVEPVPVTGTINASPDQFVITPGTVQSTQLQWSLQNATAGSIRYRRNNEPEQVLTQVSGSSGMVTFANLQDGNTYRFRLFQDGTNNVLDTATVTTQSSYGFGDSGLTAARARTEYTLYQIPSLTLRPDLCLISHPSPDVSVVNAGACPDIPNTSYQAANFWQQNGAFRSNKYWVIGMNSELSPWLSCNEGPPNMSEPNSGIDFASQTALGRYGFQMRQEASEGFWRAHLFVDNRLPAPQEACTGTDFYIPFLSVGSHYNRGNPTPVGVLNPTSPGSPSATEFTARLWKFDPDSEWTDFYIYAFAKWGGQNRGVFLKIVREGENNGLTPVAARWWNWPIEESLYFPGANLAYFNVENVDDLCSDIVQPIPRIRPCTPEIQALGQCNEGQDITFTIDWQALFECASDKEMFTTPLPANIDNIPIDGVHWAVETAGNAGTLQGSAMWMSVHNMRMVPRP